MIAFYDQDAAFDLSPDLGALAKHDGLWPLAPFLAMAGALLWVGLRREPGQAAGAPPRP